MKTLRQRMMNDFESERGLATRMAKLAGYASAAKLKSTIAKEDGEIANFNGFVRVVHEMYPDEKINLMIDFAKTLNPNRQTARYMLEYATLYKLKETKLLLIRELSESSSEESNDWAFVYNIDNALIEGTINPTEAINLLLNRNYTCADMKVFARIVEFYAHLDKQNMNILKNIYADVVSNLDSIKNEFSKNAFKARFFAIESRVAMLEDSNVSAKDNIFLVMNALDPIKANNFLQYGNSFMLTDYEKTKKYLNQAYEYAGDDIKIKSEVIKSKNFSAILHKKYEDYVYDGDLSNEIYLYCMMKNKEKAEDLLKSINLSDLTDYQKAFNFYYRGLLYNDDKLLCTSIVYFNKCGDKYYKRLPVKQLATMGVENHFLEALVS